MISDRCKVDFGYPAEAVAAQLAGLNFAEAEEFCLGIVRRIVLDGLADEPRAITLEKLETIATTIAAADSGPCTSQPAQ